MLTPNSVIAARRREHKKIRRLMREHTSKSKAAQAVCRDDGLHAMVLLIFPDLPRRPSPRTVPTNSGWPTSLMSQSRLALCIWLRSSVAVPTGRSGYAISHSPIDAGSLLLALKARRSAPRDPPRGCVHVPTVGSKYCLEDYRMVLRRARSQRRSWVGVAILYDNAKAEEICELTGRLKRVSDGLRNL